MMWTQALTRSLVDKRLSVILLMCAAMAGCSERSTTLPSVAAPQQSIRHRHSTGDAAVVVGNSYDLDTGAQDGLLVFGASGVTPLQTIATTGYPFILLANPNGGYFALTSNVKGATLAEYSSGGIVTRTLGGLTGPGAMATDSSANLYVIDSGTAVDEFSPNATTPTRTVASGTNLAYIAVDRLGRLYVASVPRFRSSKTPSSISEYPRGSATPSTVISLDKKSYLDGMAVDPRRAFLYAIEGPYAGDRTIAVYQAGSTTPVRVVENDVAVRAISVGPNGDVYVLSTTANLKGRMEIFAPGLTKHVRSFAATGNPPLACGANPILSIDVLGDLYVVDCNGGNTGHPSGVTHEYAADGRYVRTLTGLGNDPSGVIVLQ